MTEVTVQTKSKAELAMEVYRDLEAKGALGRKAFIDRMVGDHGMTQAGASTYWSNTRTKANGGQVKSYYKSKTVDRSDPAAQAAQAVKDDLLANAEVFSIVTIVDGKVASSSSFMTKKSAVDRFDRLKPENRDKCLLVEGSPDEGADVSDLVVLDR